MNILVTGARAPIAAEIIKALTLAGHQAWAADSLCAPLGASSPFCRGQIRLPSPRKDFRAFANQLRAVCVSTAIEAIVPTSEEVFWLAQATAALPISVDVRTSRLHVLSALHHKGSFAKLACQLGYGVAENHELFRPEDLARFRDPTQFVFKPVYSRFATRTLIGPTAHALNRVRPTPAEPWLAQTLVRGQELCAYNVADRGRLLLHVAYEPLFRTGIGASSYFLPIANARLRSMCERFVAVTGFTGQISFDVIETPGGLAAIECNPRGTSGVHLAAQHPEALASALLGQTGPTLPRFSAAPRMLLLPLLLRHPGTLLRPSGRARLRAARDALDAAGISLGSQLGALAGVAWEAARLRLPLTQAATADFEWNGELARD